jgi:hypothetical protein
MIDKQSGHIAYAIMAFGGFNTNLGGYVADIKMSELEDAPSYPTGTEPAWGDAEYERKIQEHYGVARQGPPPAF